MTDCSQLFGVFGEHLTFITSHALHWRKACDPTCQANILHSYCSIIREWHGKPWGFPRQPAPIPVGTNVTVESPTLKATIIGGEQHPHRWMQRRGTEGQQLVTTRTQPAHQRLSKLHCPVFPATSPHHGPHHLFALWPLSSQPSPLL